MVGGLPSLLQIQATTVDHLTRLATDFVAEGDLIKRCFTDAHQLIGRVGWTGQAYDAAYDRVDADRVTAVGLAEQRYDVAKVAQSGAQNLLLARDAALGAVGKAREAGFEVTEDLRVSAYIAGRPIEEAMRLQPAANQIAAEIRAQAASMVAIDQNTTAKLAAATGGFGGVRFTEAPFYTGDGPVNKGTNKIRLVDRTFRQGPDVQAPPPDPVTKLGLPQYNAGTLSPEETRAVYLQGELKMAQLNEGLIKQGVSAEARARTMFDLRNSLRSWTRDLMADRGLAGQLNATEPNKTLGDLIGRAQAKGLQGEQVWNSIIDSSTRSRAGVNATLGVDPQEPPPLPEVREAPGVHAGQAGETSEPVPNTSGRVPIEVGPPAAAIQPEATPPLEVGSGGGPSEPIAPRIVDPRHGPLHIVGDWDPDPEEIP